MKTETVEGARVAQYEFELEIAAKPERVWRALTDQLGSWWLPDFHMPGEDSVISLEPFPGGRLLEQCGDGGLLWYTVLAITPNESLSLAGYCTAVGRTMHHAADDQAHGQRREDTTHRNRRPVWPSQRQADRIAERRLATVVREGAQGVCGGVSAHRYGLSDSRPGSTPKGRMMAS